MAWQRPKLSGATSDTQYVYPRAHSHYSSSKGPCHGRPAVNLADAGHSRGISSDPLRLRLSGGRPRVDWGQTDQLSISSRAPEDIRTGRRAMHISPTEITLHTVTAAPPAPTRDRYRTASTLEWRLPRVHAIWWKSNGTISPNKWKDIYQIQRRARSK